MASPSLTGTAGGPVDESPIRDPLPRHRHRSVAAGAARTKVLRNVPNAQRDVGTVGHAAGDGGRRRDAVSRADGPRMELQRPESLPDAGDDRRSDVQSDRKSTRL